MTEKSVEDSGKSGDVAETTAKLVQEAVESAEESKNLISDVAEAINTLTGEKAEMGAEEAVAPEMGVTASSDIRTLNVLRKELNASMTHAMKEVIAQLTDNQQELEMMVGMYDKGSINPTNKGLVETVITDALNENKESIADGMKLMTAFVKYARGTKAIIKRAQIEAELNSMTPEEEGDDNMSVDNEFDVAMTDESDESSEKGLMELLEDMHEVEDSELDANDAQFTGEVKPEDLAKIPAGTELKDVKVAMATKEGRMALRAKLAADTLKTSPHLHEAHPKGGFTTDLDVKPAGDLAKVEDLEEQHKAMMDLANAPPKVRKEAETINRMIKAGKLNPNDLEELVSEGLDKDAVAYYRKYFGQTEGGSEFASELVKEHVKAELESELAGYRVKLARSYELTYEMVDRGLCPSDRSSITEQVDEIMKFNDDSFDSLKKVVAKHKPTMKKEAGFMPQIGMIGSGDNTKTESSDNNLVDQLSAALSSNSKRFF
jgi:hypothetical protein